MKCPRCGRDNPEDALFCEECDWKMSMPAGKEKKGKPMMLIALIALALGACSLAAWYLGSAYAAIGLGGAGLVIGSYSMNTSRAAGNERMKIFLIAAVAICSSAVGFIMGIDIL